MNLQRREVDLDQQRAEDDRNEALGTLAVRTIAVHRPSGEPAANTVIYARRGEAHAQQAITITAPGHRGHRLGMLIKLENLARLPEHCGAVATVWTGSADTNARMTAINERLGYTIVDARLSYKITVDICTPGGARIIRLPPGSVNEHTDAVNIIELGPANDELVSGAFAVVHAAHAADTPEHPPPHKDVFTKSLGHPLPDADITDFVAVTDGTVTGRLHIGLPNRGNLHIAEAELTVHPRYRRQGIGTALLDRFIEHARLHDRTELLITAPMTWENGPERDETGRRFLERRGFEQALTGVNRRCAIDALDEAEEQALLDRSATAAAAEYEIISWIGRTPTELIDTMCRLDSMILSEVPLGGLNIEPETIDAELKEAKAARNEAVGVLPVTTVARHRATGEAVANTIIGVFDDPDFHHGFQWITIVHPAHRGHRLGTLVKVVNHRLLREQFPQVQTLWTDNADVNAHMIDINVKMGYEAVDAIAEYMRRLGS